MEYTHMTKRKARKTNAHLPTNTQPHEGWKAPSKNLKGEKKKKTIHPTPTKNPF